MKKIYYYKSGVLVAEEQTYFSETKVASVVKVGDMMEMSFKYRQDAHDFIKRNFSTLPSRMNTIDFCITIINY